MNPNWMARQPRWSDSQCSLMIVKNRWEMSLLSSTLTSIILHKYKIEQFVPKSVNFGLGHEPIMNLQCKHCYIRKLFIFGYASDLYFIVPSSASSSRAEQIFPFKHKYLLMQSGFPRLEIGTVEIFFHSHLLLIKWHDIILYWVSTAVLSKML